jgi:hypothetical protein
MGIQVDITSGLPVESVRNAREAKKAEEEAALENDVVRGIATEQKLATEEGQFFIGLIMKMLETRIDQLVQADTQAQTILGVLTGLGQTVQAGRCAAERLTKVRLRQIDGNR